MGLRKKKSTLLLHCVLPNSWIRYKYYLYFCKNIQIIVHVHMCVYMTSYVNTKASGGKHQFRVTGCGYSCHLVVPVVSEWVHHTRLYSGPVCLYYLIH